MTKCNTKIKNNTSNLGNQVTTVGTKSKKISIDFITHNNPIVKDVANAQLTQLMVTVTRIGLRVDNPDSNDIIEKENKHGSEENE